MSDSDSEEDMLVVLEFHHQLPSPSNDCTFKVIGLETENPFVQYQKQVFKGEWQDCVGTKVLLTEKPSVESRDPVFSLDVPKLFDYSAQSTKVLQLRPFVLNTKSDTQDVSEEKLDEDEEESEQEQEIQIKTEVILD